MTQFSLFTSAQDNTPHAFAASLTDLAQQAPVVVPPDGYDSQGKALKPASLPLWSPAVYPQGAVRNLSNVSHLHFAVGDIDAMPDGRPLPSDAFDRLVNTLQQSAPIFGACVQTTYNHRPDAPRLRVIVPLDQPVSASDHALTWHVLDGLVYQSVGAHLDPATKDATRLYYIPAAPSLEAVQHYRSVVTSTVPASRDKWLEVGRHLGATPTQVRATERVATSDIDDVRRAQAADKHFAIDADKAVQDVEAAAIDYAVRALEPVAVAGQRYTVLTKMGALLARLGWSAVSVETFAREFIARYGGDNVEHGVRGCVNSMSYPSGYYDLIDMMPGYARSQFRAALDAIPNPTGEAIKAGREALAASVNLPGAPAQPTPPATLHVKPVDPNRDICDESEDDGEPPGPITRVVEGLDVVDGSLTFIAGPPNAGKTPTALMLALTIANGLPFGDRATTRRPVFYANFEKRYDCKQKLHRIARGLGVNPKSITVFHFGASGATLSADGSMNPTASLIKRVKAARIATGVNPIVIADTYASAVEDLDANDNLYAQPLKHFKTALHAECDVPVIALIHTRKRDDETTPFGRSDIAGSGQLGGLCEAIIGLHHPNPENQHIVELTSIRSITTDMKPMRIEWLGGDGEPLTLKVITGEELAEARKEQAPRMSEAERKEFAFQRLAQHLKTPSPLGDSEVVTLDRARLLIGAGFANKGSSAVTESIKYALNTCVQAGYLVPTGKGRVLRFRRTTAAERALHEADFTRERNSSDMIARAAVAIQSGAGSPPSTEFNFAQPFNLPVREGVT